LYENNLSDPTELIVKSKREKGKLKHIKKVFSLEVVENLKWY